MEEYLPKINIQFILFFLSLLISNISCKDIENIYDNTNGKQNLQYNKQETPIRIEPGTVYKINLDRLNSKNISFIISTQFRQFDLLIHFYPLECDIYIYDELYKGERIYNISNYNYNAFYTLISKTLFTTFDVKSLMNSISTEYQNIMCPLIINSIKIFDNTIPELVVNEKEPILFYFRDEVPKLKLIYSHNNKNPIIVSFYIKEKIRFRIECNDGEEKINKIIYYKETILIKPKSSNNKYNILITRMDPINSVVIIKVSGNNYSPFYLQNNILNLGFIPKNEICQYYYMKVYKGQEGEILLNNKRLNGKLISKIINKNENDDILNITIFPECNNKTINLSNEFLLFNEYNKKLSLTL